MRGLGLFLGMVRRNENFVLENPRPHPRYEDNVFTGTPRRDGYTLLSRADPHRQGSPPDVKGTIGLTFRGPSQDFEQ